MPVSRSNTRHKQKSPLAKSNNLLECPCGLHCQDMFQLFNHVKIQHRDHQLSDIMSCRKQKEENTHKDNFTRAKQKSVQSSKVIVDPKNDKQQEGIEGDTTIAEIQKSIEKFDGLPKILKICDGIKVDNSVQFKTALGSQSCQHMASHFLLLLEHHHAARLVVHNFLSYLQQYFTERFDGEFWCSGQPQCVPLYANDVSIEYNKFKEKYSLAKRTITQLMFVFCRWMYVNKWTDHIVLIRVGSQ